VTDDKQTDGQTDDTSCPRLHCSIAVARQK